MGFDDLFTAILLYDRYQAHKNADEARKDAGEPEPPKEKKPSKQGGKRKKHK